MSGAVAPKGAAGGLRRRGSAAAGTAQKAGGRQGPLNFYTDDSPGLKIGPVFVIGMSLGFIAFVAFLHILGKLRG